MGERYDGGNALQGMYYQVIVQGSCGAGGEMAGRTGHHYNRQWLQGNSALPAYGQGGAGILRYRKGSHRKEFSVRLPDH